MSNSESERGRWCRRGRIYWEVIVSQSGEDVPIDKLKSKAKEMN